MLVTLHAYMGEGSCAMTLLLVQTPALCESLVSHVSASDAAMCDAAMHACLCLITLSISTQPCRHTAERHDSTPCSSFLSPLLVTSVDASSLSLGASGSTS